VRARAALRPEVGVVLDGEFGDLAAALETKAVVPAGEIPGFPPPRVAGRAGELRVGLLAGRPVAVLNARAHYYEGHTMQQVAFPTRVLRELGCHTLVLAAGAGGLNPDMPPGSIVAVADHINLMGDNPLIGPNDDELGDRFPDMSEPYSRRLAGLAEQVALGQGWLLQRAVLAGVPGPGLETAAEYRFLRWVGADIVGAAIVPETIVAVHGRQRVLALTVVTHACLADNLHPVDAGEILRQVAAAAPRLTRTIAEVIRRLDEAA